MSGGDGEKATPVPIPNTEVKLLSADGSWGFPPVRVGRCRAYEKGTALEAVPFLYVLKHMDSAPDGLRQVLKSVRWVDIYCSLTGVFIYIILDRIRVSRNCMKAYFYV